MFKIKKRHVKDRKILGNKKAQHMMQLPFGMIFSILLIVAFLIVAFIAIKYFLNLQSEIKINTFAKDLQDEVDNIWRSQAEDVEFKGFLPGKIKYLCFVNFSLSSRGADKDKYDELRRYSPHDSNMFFYPLGKTKVPDRKIKHIDLEVTKKRNPYCIPNEDGKTIIKLNKDFNDVYVKVS